VKPGRNGFQMLNMRERKHWAGNTMSSGARDATRHCSGRNPFIVRVADSQVQREAPAIVQLSARTPK
jgi:hypothetical protein